MRSTFVLANCALLLSLSVSASAEVSFVGQIKPILEQHCVDCHSGWFPAGGLRLDTLANLRQGGRQGPAVIPGQPDKGWLINLVKTAPGRFSQMPPGPEQLSQAQIQLLKDWIAEGAQ